MDEKKVIKNIAYWKQEARAQEANGRLWRQRHETLIANTNELERKFHQLTEDNKLLLKRIDSMKGSDYLFRNVDPTAEVVMNMKRAMEHAINTSAALLDGMGELVDHVSGRRARREREATVTDLIGK